MEMADIGWDFDGGALENLNRQIGVDLRKITEDMQSLNINYGFGGGNENRGEGNIRWPAKPIMGGSHLRKES
jgi:hypothetical protein